MAIAILMVVVIEAISVTKGNEWKAGNESCLPWMYRLNGKGQCKCGVSLGGKIECEIINGSHVVHMQNCLCITYDNSTEMAVVGYCPYACISS